MGATFASYTRTVSIHKTYVAVALINSLHIINGSCVAFNVYSTLFIFRFALESIVIVFFLKVALSLKV